jgi:hypothetical protein
MMGLARPPNRWNAETATPPVLETLAAAVDPISGSMVKADVTRLGTLISSENGCVRSIFQERIWLGRVRLQNWRA